MTSPSRATRHAWRAVLAASLLLASSAASAAPKYIYCVVVDLGEQNYWFSTVFQGDGSKTFELEKQHLAFVRTLDKVSEEEQSFCFAEDTEDAAKRERLAKVEGALKSVFAIYGSGWPEP
jgi:hypothetical protein